MLRHNVSKNKQMQITCLWTYPFNNSLTSLGFHSYFSCEKLLSVNLIRLVFTGFALRNWIGDEAEPWPLMYKWLLLLHWWWNFGNIRRYICFDWKWIVQRTYASGCYHRPDICPASYYLREARMRFLGLEDWNGCIGWHYERWYKELLKVQKDIL